MLPTPDQQAPFAQVSHREPAAAGVLNFRGERLSESMELFGVKPTCALYYEHARRIIGTGEAVSVRMYTNADALEGKLPGELLAIMGENITLRQGRWSVAGALLGVGIAVVAGNAEALSHDIGTDRHRVAAAIVVTSSTAAPTEAIAMQFKPGQQVPMLHSHFQRVILWEL